MKENYDKAAASELIAAFGAAPEMLVQILNAFVEKFTYISDEAIRYIADELNLSRADVHKDQRPHSKLDDLTASEVHAGIRPLTLAS